MRNKIVGILMLLAGLGYAIATTVHFGNNLAPGSDAEWITDWVF